MDMQTLVHGRKEFKVTLKYRELTNPLTAAFHTQIERDAFLEGIKFAAPFLGEPETITL